MFKVAFWFDAPVEYSGGLNYVKNLLYALSLVNDGSVRPYVFFGADVPADVEDAILRVCHGRQNAVTPTRNCAMDRP